MQSVLSHFTNKAGITRPHKRPRLSTLLLILLLPTSALASNASLTLGPFANGVVSGTPPFGLTDDCSQAGDDCGIHDFRVRTNDVMTMSWSVTVDGMSSDQDTLSAIVFEQTLIAGNGASVEFEAMPAICLHPQPSDSVDQPTSSITSDGETTTLRCNLGTLANGELRSFSVAVKPLPGSSNGATFESQQWVYGVDDQGQKITDDATYDIDQEFSVSAAPAFDLIGNRSRLARGEVVVHDIGNGAERGLIYQYTAHIAAPDDRGLLGAEALQDSFSFDAGFYARQTNGEDPFDLDYAIVDCRANEYNGPKTVYGNESYNPDIPDFRKTVRSGDCDISGDPVNGFQLTVSNTDTTGIRYPTETLDGTSLQAGPYFTSAYSIDVFIPFSEIDRSDNSPGDEQGTLVLGACLGGFDPDGISGTSNFLSGFEPGHNGELMPDGSRSNNCTERAITRLGSGGEFSLRAVSLENDSADLTQYAPLISEFHSGDGLAEPGQSYATLFYYHNNGSQAVSDFNACVAFDNTVQHLDGSETIDASPGSHAYLGNQLNADDWIISYGIARYSGDDPLNGDADPERDFDRDTGRYHGRWNRLSRIRCASENFEWHNTVTDDNRGQINLVRLTPASDSVWLNPGEEIRLVVPLTLRNRFAGGPHDGRIIPTGTVAASTASFRSADTDHLWHMTRYQPAPENSETDGDRMTVSRANIKVKAKTLSPAANQGEVSSVLAGSDIIWEVTPQAASTAFADQPIKTMIIETVLSAGTHFNSGCTLGINGFLPDAIRENYPATGQTRLRWIIGNVDVNTEIPAITLCSTTDAMLAPGTAVSVKATARATNAVTSPTVLQRVSVGQSGLLAASTSAETAIAVRNEKQNYTLTWANFSNTAVIDKPVMINIFPHNGDGSGSTPRQPASEFSGSLTLAGIPSVTYRDSGETTVDASGVMYFTSDHPLSIDPDPATNESDWCQFNGKDFVPAPSAVNCPAALSEVTAIKFVAADNLGPQQSASSVLEINYTLDTIGNRNGDVYTNRFSVDSASLPSEQYVVSRSTTINVAAHAVSGSVFAALDGDSYYDQTSDAPVPDGVTVELYDVATDERIRRQQTSAGRYHFGNLSAGDYRIVIPAEVFGNQGALPQWTLSDNLSEDSTLLDLSVGNAAQNGVVSLPLAVLGSTRVDVALQPNDADADGISDLIEFGNRPFIDENEDTDGDGIANFIDPDSDDDGIPDIVETTHDTDGDGIENYKDSDSDGDGIPDLIEGTNDHDNDNIPDYIDNIDNTDSDNDQISDIDEGESDSDNDGTPDKLDNDSDNDGIEDSVEKNTDTDGDGIPNYIDTDSDNDGIDDSLEGNQDLDNNAIPDYLDNQSEVDTDRDGIPDIIEGNGDNDGDLLPNLRDPDSDNDSISDQIETVTDTDGDGIADYLDLDADNDSIPDEIETAIDTDNDSIPDFKDSDSDNDGRSDIEETGGLDLNTDGKIDNPLDQDRDGIDDLAALTLPEIADTDFDGVFDYIDHDSDNDSIPDVVETLGKDADMDRNGIVDQFIDADSNGMDENAISQAAALRDVDGDGIPNALDLDSDGDGRSDLIESGIGPGFDANGDSIVDPMTDTDRDAIQDNVDVDQTLGPDENANGIDDRWDLAFVDGNDKDGDLILNFVDPDFDGDGFVDLQLSDPESPQQYPDFDGNGRPDFQQELTGVLETGVGGEGVGCVIQAHRGVGSGRTESRMDPTLILLLLLSVAGLYSSRRKTFLR